MCYQFVAVLCVFITLKYDGVMHIDRKLLDSCLKPVVKTHKFTLVCISILGLFFIKVL